MVRRVAFACLLAPCLCFAATPDEQIQTAFDQLRAHVRLFMRLDGTERIDGQEHHIVADAYWDTTPSGAKTLTRAKVALYKDEQERYLTVGDGTSVWNYDVLKNEYSVNAYGSYTDKQPDDYQDALLQSLVAYSRGASVFPARMLRDIFGGQAATYKPWIPGGKAVQAANVVSYSVGDPLRRQVTYTLDASTGDLLSMSYFDSKGAQQVSWTMDFFLLLPDANFDFTPPAGAKPIVGSN